MSVMVIIVRYSINVSKMRYCSRCTYPEVAISLSLDSDGICSGCRMAETYNAISPNSWAERERKFRELLASYQSKNGSNYDCMIAVSGGKDSYWQTYLIKVVCGLNPLLVTYHGNRFLPEAQGNLDRMRDVFDVDHLVFGPSTETLRKLNRACFKKMGDMNWHDHAGIKTVPIIAAVKLGIPIVIWGEAPWIASGMFSPHGYVEYDKSTVIEHSMQGYGWQDIVGEENLEPKDLVWLHFPSDEQIARIGMRGLYIGNFFKWDPSTHAQKMHEEYEFEFARHPFERTYCLTSNLDNMHGNGVHDYMKFVKFGYGRASDHTSDDIRTGYMSREDGIGMVQKYDHIKPQFDLECWLEYTGMTEDEFDQIADTFRSPKVWWIENGQWVKDNIWGEPSAYGAVHLQDPDQISRFQR